LLLLLRPDGLFYTAFHQPSARFAALRGCRFINVSELDAMQSAVAELISEEEWLLQKYASVKAAIASPVNTLVPASLFDADRAREALGFCHDLTARETVRNDPLPSLEAVNVYALPEALCDYLNTAFAQPRIYHAASGMLEVLCRLRLEGTGSYLYAHVQTQRMEVALFKKRQLVFYNQFGWQTAEDFIYYLMAVLEQFHLSPEEVQLTLLGELERDSALYRLIYKYIRNVDFGSRPAGFQYASALDLVPEHYYFSLFSIKQCESSAEH